MAKPKALAALGAAKTRTFILLLGVLIIIGLAVAITQMGGETGTQEVAKLAPVPSSIKAVPGQTSPEKYQELLKQENIRRAEEAEKTKGSAIPTIIGAASDDALQKQLDQRIADQDLEGTGASGLGDGASLFGDITRGGFIGSGIFNPRGTQATSEQQSRDQKLKEQRERLEKMRAEKARQAELERLRKEAEKERAAYRQSVEQTSAAMQTHATAAFQAWGAITEQSYVESVVQTDTKKDKDSIQAQITQQEEDKIYYTTKDGIKLRRQYIKAGSILFAVLDTAINSDEPGPVLATIVHGKYKGGKLIGSIDHPDDYAEKIIVKFSVLSLPKHAVSISVDAVAIDPDTARTALASDVDRHYLLRYGSLFASAFLEGYGKAISQQGTVTTSPNGTTQETKPDLSGRDQFFAALGKVGEEVGKATKPFFKTPYTITVDQGVGLGLLFLSDVDVTNKDEG